MDERIVNIGKMRRRNSLHAERELKESGIPLGIGLVLSKLILEELYHGNLEITVYETRKTITIRCQKA